MKQVRFFVLFSTAICITSTAGCFNSGPPENQKMSLGEARLLSKVGLKYDKLHWFVDEDERPALEAVHQKYKTDLKNWYAQHGEAVEVLGKALVKFVKTKDQTEARQAIKKAQQDNTKELVRERDRILTEYEAAVIASVPPGKLALWQADKICRTLLEFLKPLELTEEQKDRVHELAPRALQQVLEADKRIWHPKAVSNLEALIGQEMLTPVQQRQFVKLKEANPLRKLKWIL